jgi:hypothetical protein
MASTPTDKINWTDAVVTAVFRKCHVCGQHNCEEQYGDCVSATERDGKIPLLFRSSDKHRA